MSKWLNGFAVFDTQSLDNPFVKDSGDEISVEDVASSADEKLLATTDRNRLTTLWDVKQRKTIGGLQGPQRPRLWTDVLSSGRAHQRGL